MSHTSTLHIIEVINNWLNCKYVSDGFSTSINSWYISEPRCNQDRIYNDYYSVKSLEYQGIAFLEFDFAKKQCKLLSTNSKQCFGTYTHNSVYKYLLGDYRVKKVEVV